MCRHYFLWNPIVLAYVLPPVSADVQRRFTLLEKSCVSSDFSGSRVPIYAHVQRPTVKLSTELGRAAASMQKWIWT